ncbi:MAG: hypothetical protein AB7Y74_15515, partial [Syntrophorhabdus sp.]
MLRLFEILPDWYSLVKSILNKSGFFAVEGTAYFQNENKNRKESGKQLNETCTSWNIHQVAKIKEVLGNISREAHEKFVVDYMPLSDNEATAGDIALMVQSTQNKILEMFVGIVVADAHTQAYSPRANKMLYEAINNLFTEGRAHLKLYRNKKYKYGAEYRVEVAQMKEIYRIMFQHKILPGRNGGKKNYLKIGVNFETYQWLNESAKNAGTSIGGVIEELVKIKKYCNPDERVFDKTCNPDERVWDKTCNPDERVWDKTCGSDEGQNSISYGKYTDISVIRNEPLNS